MSFFVGLKEYMNSKTPEKCFLLLLSIVFANTFWEYIRGFVNTRLTIIEPINTYFLEILMGVTAFLALPYLRKKVGFYDMVIYILLVLIYQANYIIYPENTKALELHEYNFIYYALPCLFIGKGINVRKCLDWLYFFSLLSILFAAFYYLVFIQTAGYTGSAVLGKNEYQMAASYRLLPCVLLVLYKMFKDISLINVGVSVLGILMIFSFGTRGPLMCVLIFVTLYLLLIKQYENPTLWKCVTIGISVIIYAFFEPIIIFIAAVVSGVGMNPRILNFMLEGVTFGGEGSSDSRLEYVDILSDRMVNMPFFGYGFESSYNVIGTYPHNIMIEFLYSFGYVVGIVLMLALLCIMVHKYLRQNTEEGKMFVLLLVCTGFVPNFMSGTFVDNRLLYVLIGYCIARPISEKQIWLNFKIPIAD